MYCKHCGKEIDDDSKFCRHCGGVQEMPIANPKENVVEEKSNTKEKVVEIPTIKVNLSAKTKWIICLYSLWVVANLYCLLAKEKSGHAAEYFLPFTKSHHIKFQYYDITEFIVYVVGVPIVLWGASMFYKKYIKI